MFVIILTVKSVASGENGVMICASKKEELSQMVCYLHIELAARGQLQDGMENTQTNKCKVP
jgi:hypothetical protein